MTANERSSGASGSPGSAGSGKTEKRRRVTSYDVARRAGVSQAAVSRCFKPGASASKKTREKVYKAARELGYRPNAIARGLITRRSNMVAVVISNLTNLYYPEVLAHLSQRFSDRGVRVLLFTLERESAIDDILEQIWQYQVDGVVAAARLSIDQIRQFEQGDIPLVFYNRHFNDYPVNAVCCDQQGGAAALVDRLADAGLRRFGLIAGPEDSVVGQERISGARRQLAARGIDSVALADGDYSYESGAAALTALTESFGTPPDAVIAANDVMALGCLDAAREQFGLRVPNDISVVGFDGVGPASWASYRLTTIRQPVRRMSEAAVSMIMERIEDHALPPEKRVFSGQFIEGRSAKAAVAEAPDGGISSQPEADSASR